MLYIETNLSKIPHKKIIYFKKVHTILKNVQ